MLTMNIPHGWKIRQQTHDLEIYRCVVEQDEYRIRDIAFGSDDIVVDVGAHIGWFAAAAEECGARRGICYEPWKENYELLQANLGALGGRWKSHNVAVWRSDVEESFICYRPSEDSNNTGGGDVLGKYGAAVPWVSLDSILMECGSVNLLKLDCEYSEFPILLTSKELHRVENIVGEYHEIGKGTYHGLPIPPWAAVDGAESYTRHTLREHLESVGFTVEIEHEAENIGKFFARRNSLVEDE